MQVSPISAAPPATIHRPAEPVRGVAATTGEKIDLATVMKAVSSIKARLEPVGGGLEFNVDQASGRTVVRVVDLETNQIIRQIPSEEMVELARVLERLEGLLVDKHA